MERALLAGSFTLLLPALASAGTLRLAGLPADVSPSGLLPTPEHLFVVGSQNGFPTRLWVTDGTPETSHLVSDEQGRALLTPQAVTVFRDHLYVSAEAAGTGTHALYRMQGDTPQRIAEASPSRGYPGEECFYFGVPLPGGFGQLWRSDGTPSGTHAVGTQMPGLPTDAAVLGTSLLFSFFDAGGNELWKAEGSSVGRLIDIAPGAAGSAPSELTRLGNVVTFFTRGGPAACGGELWKSDGTAAGTTMVKAMNTGANSGGVWAEDPHAAAGTLLFRAVAAGDARAVWKSDATLAGTVKLANLSPPVQTPHPLLAAGSTTFFVAVEGGISSLYSTDGTTAGTVAIAPLGASTFTVRGSKLFVASGTQLWSTTGTAASIVVEGDKPEGGELALGTAGRLVTAAGRIFAAGTDPTYGHALWVLDESQPEPPDGGTTDAGASSSSGGNAEDAGASSSGGGSSSGRPSGSSSGGSSSSSGGRASSNSSSGSAGAGSSGAGDAATDEDDDEDSSGEHGCNMGAGGGSLHLLVFGAVAAGLRRRRVRP